MKTKLLYVSSTSKDTGNDCHPGMSALFEFGEVRNFRNLDDIDVVVPDHWFENEGCVVTIASADCPLPEILSPRSLRSTSR